MSDDYFTNLELPKLMDTYQFVHVATIIAPDLTTFSINIDLEEAFTWKKSIYIFVFNNEIVRIGSSKGMLGRRMKQWSRDVTNALLKSALKTNTPEWEAKQWMSLLQLHKTGTVYARRAATVTTPIGTFEAYMDEESTLINRHRPRLNRHKNR